MALGVFSYNQVNRNTRGNTLSPAASRVEALLGSGDFEGRLPGGGPRWFRGIASHTIRRSLGTIASRMELFTIGYEGRTLPQLLRLLEEAGVRRLVDVRERPASRKPGFSAVPLFDALRKAGIVYESDPGLGNPKDVRDRWKNGELALAKRQYRRMLRNGRKPRVEALIGLAKIDRVAVLCYERESELCHRGLIAAEAARLAPRLRVHHL